MTTVIDPLGTPSPVYNRSGTVILAVTPGATSGSTQGSAIGNNGTPIPSVAQETVVTVATSFSSGAWNTVVLLPSAAEIGDVVEVYTIPDVSFAQAVVFPNVGESIAALPASTGTNDAAGIGTGTTSGIRLRKVSSTLWMPIA